MAMTASFQAVQFSQLLTLYAARIFYNIVYVLIPGFKSQTEQKGLCCLEVTLAQYRRSNKGGNLLSFRNLRRSDL